MPATLNHLAFSRARLAEASRLADSGSAADARAELFVAADHALIALAARDRHDAEVGRAQVDELAHVLRDLDDDDVDAMQDPQLAARLAAGFGLVQALIDANVATPLQPARALPRYGGGQGVLNARGAEAAVRGIARIGYALRGLLRR
jgi:hypothetical protein